MNRVQSRLVEEIIMVEDFDINKIQFYKGNEKTDEEFCKKKWEIGDESHLDDVHSDIVQLVSDFSETWGLYVETDMFCAIIINNPEEKMMGGFIFAQESTHNIEVTFQDDGLRANVLENICYTETRGNLMGNGSRRTGLSLGDAEERMANAFYAALRKHTKKLDDEKRVSFLNFFGLLLGMKKEELY